jgi:predicted kinase
VSTLFATHPALLAAPLGLYPCVHALVRDHMWTYAGDRITSGAALRMTHLTDPALLVALWDADARGRICDDPDDVADRVGYAGLVLDDLDAARADSHGPLDQVDPDRSADPRARRETFRALIEGGPAGTGAVAAQLAAASRHSTGGSLTYTIGLPGVGKSSWARQVWQPATGGVVLSGDGPRRRDRRAATAAVLQAIPRLLAAGAAVCVDATHPVRESRDVLVTYAGRYGAPLHAVLFRAALATALGRQDTRDPDDAVPRARIEDLQRRMRWPTPDEYQTLTVVEESGAAWSYTPQSRWLDAAEAVRRFGVRDTPWAR